MNPDPGDLTNFVGVMNEFPLVVIQNILELVCSSRSCEIHKRISQVIFLLHNSNNKLFLVLKKK